ncbi:hypothetical protein OSTOST_03745 [Ostertagia ostertagi]
MTSATTDTKTFRWILFYLALPCHWSRNRPMDQPWWKSSPTNPFLQDIAAQETLQPSPLPPPYHSEFGLPPPSDLALGKKD